MKDTKSSRTVNSSTAADTATSCCCWCFCCSSNLQNIIDINFVELLQLKETYLSLTMAISNDTSIDVNNINVLGDNVDVNDDFIMKNLCVQCNVDMGECNPRQLCGKTRCLEIDNNNNEVPPAMKKRKKNSHSKKLLFLSMEKFMEHVKVSQATKWTDLDQSKIYRVTEVEEVAVNTNETDEAKRMAKVGTFEDSDGEVVRVWLPSIVAKELTCINLEVIDTYIRSLGPKTSKTGRTYHNFKVVKNQQQAL